MALTGQLSDMSLAELIEFFCNQRKTGRLKVDYHRGHGVFYIKDGELVDAKVGALDGVEAVYFALTLPNAAFDFSGDIEPPRRTIKEAWTQVVLEGLRRLDENSSPSESDAFGANWTPTDAEVSVLMDRIERLDAGHAATASAERAAEAANSESRAANRKDESPAPFSMMVESASAQGGGKKKALIAVAACVVLACAVAAVPLAKRFKSASPAPSPAASSEETTTQPNAESADAAATSEAASAEGTTSPVAEPQPILEEVPAGQDAEGDAMLAAKRERESRERAARERRQQEEARRKRDEAQAGEGGMSAAAVAPPPAAAKPAAGPKIVRVSVSYDESGRVTQASVAGATPGAEGYGATAVRVARGRRFPAGQPGSAVVSIPVN